MWKRFLVVVLLMASFSDAYSFESYEHKRVGDRSFRIALDMAGIKCPSDTYKSICDLLADDRAPNKVTYGTIVERMDYMMEPSVMLAMIGNGVSYPTSVLELNPDLFGKGAILNDSYFRSSHNNDAHFQAQLLFELHDWHKRALAVIDTERNLFAGVVMNAASDHFLQDFFAPGHIVTPRFNFPDAFALGMHDLNNDLGATFYVSNWDKLQPILGVIRANPTHYGFSQETIDSLARNHSYIYLHGDAELSENPKQELFMTLVDVYSINEILACASRETACSQTSFANYTWQTSRVDDHYRPVSPPRASIYFGSYELSMNNVRMFSPVVGISAGEETLHLGTGQNRYTYTVEIAPGGWPGSPDYFRKPDGTPVFSLNIGPAIGYTWISSSAYTARGPALRLIMARPQVDAQYSLYWRSMHYSYSNVALANHREYGIRADLGFSMFTGFVAIGRSYGIDFSSGSLRQATQLSFGVELAGPISRVWGLSKIESWAREQAGEKLPNN
jgi:hypothetical protein